MVFSFSIPGFNALALGTAAQLGYKPQWVVCSVGRPSRPHGIPEGAAAPLTDGMIAASYLPDVNDTTNSWNKLFTDIHHKYNAERQDLRPTCTATHWPTPSRRR